MFPNFCTETVDKRPILGLFKPKSHYQRFPCNPKSTVCHVNGNFSYHDFYGTHCHGSRHVKVGLTGVYNRLAYYPMPSIYTKQSLTMQDPYKLRLVKPRWMRVTFCKCHIVLSVIYLETCSYLASRFLFLNLVYLSKRLNRFFLSKKPLSTNKLLVLKSLPI